jgi:CRISPR type IV-associated protein Csf3
MQSPIMLNHPFILADGFFFYRAAEEQLGDLSPVLQARHADPIFETINVPLCKTEFNDLYVYHASILRFDVSVTQLKSFYRYFDMSSLRSMQREKQKPRYLIAGGPFKLERRQYPVLSTPTATFWIKGNLEFIIRTLDHLNGIGKRCNSGYGQIKSYEIKEIPEDYSIFHPTYKINRTIPISMITQQMKDLDKVNIAQAAYKPPNWAYSTTCVLPTMEVF